MFLFLKLLASGLALVAYEGSQKNFLLIGLE